MATEIMETGSYVADGDELPLGWEWTTIGEVCSPPQYGWTTSGSGTGELHLLRTTDITAGQIVWDSVPYCEVKPPDPSKYLLEDGDIVVSRAGSVGFSHLLRQPRPAVFASYLIRFRPIGILPEYLAYFLQSPEYWRSISEAKLGIAVQNVNATKLKQIRVPLAPASDQPKIVEAIETQLTRLSAAEDGLERIRANLRRYRASVLKAACEGCLVPTEAELARAESRAYEPASALLERILAERRAKWEQEHPGRRYVEPVGPDTSQLPELPEGWAWATVEQLADNAPNSITDGPFGSKLKTEHYTLNGPRVIRLQNIGDGQFIDEKAHISDEHYETLLKHQVYAQDLVIAALGQDLPRSCMIPDGLGPAIVKADCIRFKPNPKLAMPSYLNLALNSEVTKKIARHIVHGIGRPRLNQQEVKSLPCPLPPVSEQQRMVAEADKCLSIADELSSLLVYNVVRSQRFRQSILKRAFSGQLNYFQGENRSRYPVDHVDLTLD